MIKALAAEEQRAWLEGQGMGLAKPAELNGYPGPMHVLEHAGALGLSPSKEEETDVFLRLRRELDGRSNAALATEFYRRAFFSMRPAPVRGLPA